MKDLLIQALNEAFVGFERKVPQTKRKTESVSIMDIKPLELASFMESNNIPNTAYFDGTDNGDDGWKDFVLSWDVDVPTTDKDKLDFKRKRFTDIAWNRVYDSLTKNGYKRIGFFNTELLKEFNDTTMYDMYINKDFDRIEKYYSLPFIKEV